MMTLSIRTKKLLKRTFLILAIAYVIICTLLYFFQEKLIFSPEKLEKNYAFNFPQPFEEVNIQAADHKILNGILFRSDSSKGVIFYLHGKTGALNEWGYSAKVYTDLHYDVFMLDYRGYGKSEGTISNQQQLFDDIQAAYDEIKKRYSENKIVLLGYSLGTGFAAKLASENHPALLILQAPYYSTVDLMKHVFPVVPAFLLKYKIRTNEYIIQCKAPIVIFHGDNDKTISYGSSLKLKKLLRSTDTLITLHGVSHNGITYNPEYKKDIQRILNR